MQIALTHEDFDALVRGRPVSKIARLRPQGERVTVNLLLEDFGHPLMLQVVLNAANGLPPPPWPPPP